MEGQNPGDVAGRLHSPHHAQVIVRKLEAIVSDTGAPEPSKAQVRAFVGKHCVASPPAAAKSRQHWNALLVALGYDSSDIGVALAPLSETEPIYPAQIGPIIRALSLSSSN